MATKKFQRHLSERLVHSKCHGMGIRVPSDVLADVKSSFSMDPGSFLENLVDDRFVAYVLSSRAVSN